MREHRLYLKQARVHRDTVMKHAGKLNRPLTDVEQKEFKTVEEYYAAWQESQALWGEIKASKCKPWEVKEHASYGAFDEARNRRNELADSLVRKRLFEKGLYKEWFDKKDINWGLITCHARAYVQQVGRALPFDKEYYPEKFALLASLNDFGKNDLLNETNRDFAIWAYQQVQSLREQRSDAIAKKEVLSTKVEKTKAAKEKAEFTVAVKEQFIGKALYSYYDAMDLDEMVEDQGIEAVREMLDDKYSEIKPRKGFSKEEILDALVDREDAKERELTYEKSRTATENGEALRKQEEIIEKTSSSLGRFVHDVDYEQFGYVIKEVVGVQLEYEKKIDRYKEIAVEEGAYDPEHDARQLLYQHDEALKASLPGSGMEESWNRDEYLQAFFTEVEGLEKAEDVYKRVELFIDKLEELKEEQYDYDKQCFVVKNSSSKIETANTDIADYQTELDEVTKQAITIASSTFEDATDVIRQIKEASGLSLEKIKKVYQSFRGENYKLKGKHVLGFKSELRQISELQRSELQLVMKEMGNLGNKKDFAHKEKNSASHMVTEAKKQIKEKHSAKQREKRGEQIHIFENMLKRSFSRFKKSELKEVTGYKRLVGLNVIKVKGYKEGIKMGMS